MRIANHLHPALNAGFDTYTSQPDNTTGMDTMVSSESPGVSSGALDAIRARHVDRGWALIKFDFSSITGTCNSGFLYYYNVGSPQFGAGYVYVVGGAEVHRSVYPWYESTVWSTRQVYDATVMGTGPAYTPPNTYSGEERAVGLNAGLLQQLWDGTYTNYGFAIFATVPETINATTDYFASCEYATPSLRPKMVIVYTPPAPPPPSASPSRMFWFM